MKTFIRICFVTSFYLFFYSIDAVFAQSATFPIVTKQPVGGTFAKNAELRLYVQAQSLDGGLLTYQWYQDGSPVSGATRAVLDTQTPGTAGSHSYYCRITNNVNGTTATVQSLTVTAKIIDREYPDHLINGDMEYWRYPGGITDPNQSSLPNTFYKSYTESAGTIHFLCAANANEDPLNGWYTTHQTLFTAASGSNQTNSGPIEVGEPLGMYGMNNNGNGTYCIELNASVVSSLYQQVATIPGKIYEWSLDHGSRPTGVNRIAVIIGQSINGNGDYLTGTTNRYASDLYPYGISSSSSVTDIYFMDILQILANQVSGGNKNNIPVGNYTISYNSSVYYICVVEATYKPPTLSDFRKFSGVYSVPEKQGTTVFAFVGIQPTGSSGNNLDNVVFASGSGLSLSPSMSYPGSSSLSVTTKSGFVYGVCEVRGSSTSLVPDIESTFNDLPAPVASVGSQWYYPNATGTLTFQDLTPGKTYRIVGVPLGAVSAELGTNLSPSYVLDEGYYEDFCMPPSTVGDHTQTGLVTGSVYMSGSDCRARLAVMNTNPESEYALVETTGVVVPGGEWRQGLGLGTNTYLLYENLVPDHDYLIVVRPAGYSEIDYQSSLLSGLAVKTPSCTGVSDIHPEDLTLSGDGTTLTLSVSDSRADYGVYDPSTGLFVGGDLQTGGGTLTFSGLTPGQIYHITMKENISHAVFSTGVRIYPLSESLSIDYSSEIVRNGAGLFPLGIEYRLNTANGYVLGDADTWRRVTDSYPLSLGKPLYDLPTPILDSLKILSVSTGTFYYRAQPGLDGWTGPFYSPEKTLEIPRRPSPPLRNTHYSVNYRAERMEIINPNNILYSINSGYTWSAVQTSASPVSFYPDLNWVEVSKNISLRFPSTLTAFASDTTVQQIKGRGEEPRGVMAIIDQSQVTVGQLHSETSYQYSLESPISWTDYTTGQGESSLTGLVYNPSYDYLIRYAATDDSPASYSQILSAPLMVLPVNFGMSSYGLPVSGMDVVVKNTDGSPQNILAIELQGGNSGFFTLSPALDDNNRIVPGALSNSQLGENTQFTITPNENLPVGRYQTTVRVQYLRGVTVHWSTANVYLTVMEAEWGETLVAGITGATSSSLTVRIGGVPSGAQVELRLEGGSYVSGVPGANNSSSYTFTELSPASGYVIYYRLPGDANHNATPEIAILGWTAYAPENAVRVNYTTEMLLMRSGYSAENYDVSIDGVPVMTLPYQVSNEAETGFTVSVVRKDPFGIIPSSEPYTFIVSGREPAPPRGDITLVSSSNESAYDGSITFANSNTGFQYRLSGSMDVMSGWTSVTGSTGSILHLNSYDVRYPATGSQFASKYRTLDMDQVPSFTVTPQFICEGGSVNLSSAISEIGNQVTIHYYTGGDGSGELTGSSQTVSPSGTTIYYVQGISDATGFKSNMKILVVTVNSIPGITLSSTSERICATGESLDLSTLVSSYTNGALYYYSDASCSIALGSSIVSTPGDYYVRVENMTTGCKSNARKITISEKTATGITVQPAATTTECFGTNITLQVTATGTLPLSYQWYKSPATPLSGATGSNYHPTVSGTYYVKVNGSCGEVQSNDAAVTIYPLPVPVISPSGTTVYTGETINYSTDLGNNNYLWTPSNGLISGGNTAQTAAVTWGGAGTGNLSASYSDPVTGCTGTTSLLVSIIAQGSPVISGSTSVCRDATGEVYSTESDKKSYDWDVTGGTFTGQGTNSISVTWTSASQTGNKVSVKYKSTLGSPYTAVTDYPVEVKQAPSVSNISVSSLYCVGSVLSLSVPTFTPHGSLVSSHGWLLDEDPITMPYTLKASDHGKKLKYYAKCSCDLTGYSNEATLNVGSAPTIGSITTPAAVCAGTSMSLTVPTATANVASVTEEGWMLDNVKIQATYQPAYTDNNKELKYYAETASCGTGYSNTVNITVYDKPIITGAPTAGQQVCAGSLLSLSTPTVNYRGNTASKTEYWVLDGVQVDLSTYRFHSTDNNKNLSYYAQNSCGNTTSNQVTVTVNVLPQPAISPSGTLYYVGDDVPYTTDAGKNAYSWSVSNALITDGTGQSPTITWNAAGASSATVSYTDPVTGCTGSTILHVTVQTIADPNLLGPAYACKDETGVVYSTDSGKDSYDWNVTGGTITDGSGTSQITVTWTSSTQSGNEVSVRFKPTSVSDYSPLTRYQVKVKQAPVIATISVQNLYCNQYTLNLSAPLVTAQGSGVTSQGWLLDNSPITMPYVLSAANHGKKLKYYAECDCGFTSYSNEVTLNVGMAPTLGSITAPGPVCSGTSMILSSPTVIVNVAPVMEEGWLLDGKKMITSYQPTYQDNNKTLQYYAETQSCGTGYSNTMNITVNDKPVITGSPTTSPAICEDGLLSLSLPTVDYRGNTSSQAEYWTLDGVQIDLSSYRFQVADNNKTLSYRAENACGSTTSTGVKVIVRALPVITINHNKSNDGTCMNTPVTFTTASGQSGYTWSWSEDGATATGGTSTDNTLTLSWSTSGTKTVRVNYTNVNGCTAVTPSTKTVLINPTPETGVFQDITICSGSNSGVILPTGGVDVNSYTWSGGASVGLTDNTTTLNLTSIPGFTGASVSSATTATVTVIPHYVNNSTTCDGSSTTFRVTVNPVTAITTQPSLASNVTYASGYVIPHTDVNLGVTAIGPNLSYEWYKDGIPLTNTGKYSGVSSSTLRISDVYDMEDGDYYVVVSGDCGSTTSNTVSVNIMDASLKDLQVNGVSVPDFQPDQTDYRLIVPCTDEQATILGIPSSSNITNLTGNGVYVLEAGDNYFTVSVTASDGTTTMDYTVNVIRDCHAPKITKDLEDAIICIGESYTFEVEVESVNENLIYEWYCGNNRIWGANTNRYTISNAELKDYERYYVIIRNGYGHYRYSVYSRNVRLWIADYLPETLQFSDCPDIAAIGNTYHIQLAGYSDITQYVWNYRVGTTPAIPREDNDGVTFTPATGEKGQNETWATFGTLSMGTGTLTVTLEHPCGMRQASQTIKVEWPTGTDNITTNTIVVSPNPTSDLITVSNTKPNHQIRITDITGSVKGTYPTLEGTTAIDLTGYAKGTYLLLYEGKTFKVIRK